MPSNDDPMFLSPKAPTDFGEWNNPFTPEEWQRKNLAFYNSLEKVDTFAAIADALEAYAAGNEWVMAIDNHGRKTYMDPTSIIDTLRTDPRSLERRSALLGVDEGLTEAYARALQNDPTGTTPIPGTEAMAGQ